MRKTSTKIFSNSLFGIFVLLLFSTMANPTFSQQLEGNWWYFGQYAGVQFSNGFAEADTNGVMNSLQSVATISDSNGNLLFYTDGSSVYNKNHQITPNGNNIFPVSGLRYSMIVQHPYQNKLYYVFSTYSVSATAHRLRYFIFDSEMDSGLGDVVQNSSVILTDTLYSSLACADHSNKKDKWLITYSKINETFISFPIDSFGFSENNRIISNNNFFPNHHLLGPYTFKTSPNSKFLSVLYQHPVNTIQAFEFDNTNGIVHNRFFEKSYPNVSGNEFFGTSFSPNSKILYAAHRRRIFQFNISSLDSATIEQSEYLVDTVIHTISPTVNTFRDLQLALDGKIYCVVNKYTANSPYLSIIKCPNKLGVECNYNIDYVDLQGRWPGYNLPALNQTLFVNAHILQAQNKSGPICPGDSARLVAYGAGADRFIWTLLDGSAANSLSNDTLPNPLAFPDPTTTYRVVGIASSCTVDNLDTAYITVVVNPPTIKTVEFSC